MTATSRVVLAVGVGLLVYSAARELLDVVLSADDGAPRTGWEGVTLTDLDVDEVILTDGADLGPYAAQDPPAVSRAEGLPPGRHPRACYCDGLGNDRTCRTRWTGRVGRTLHGVDAPRAS